MSRDYSSQRNASRSDGRRAATRKSRPAAKATQAKSRSGGGPPGWIWLVCGLCIGLTVAAGFYMFARPVNTSPRTQISIATPGAGTDEQVLENNGGAATAPSITEKEEEPRFSFYKMLPDYEVVIPEEEYPDQGKSALSNRGSPVGEPPAPDKPEPTVPKVEEPGSYIIQAGSFSTFEDADRRKAELALLGLSARIVDVDLASGKTVYRVQSSTIGSGDRLNDMLKRLRENSIDTLVMRAKN